MARSLLNVLAVLLIIVVSTSNAIDSKTISQICRNPEIRNQSYCFRLLDPFENRDIDLKNVADIVLEKSVSKISKAKSLITSLVADETDTIRKQGFVVCAKRYDEALADVEKALDLLALNKLKFVRLHVWYAKLCFQNEINVFEEVWNETDDIMNTVSVALVVSDMLAPGGHSHNS